MPDRFVTMTSPIDGYVGWAHRLKEGGATTVCGIDLTETESALTTGDEGLVREHGACAACKADAGWSTKDGVALFRSIAGEDGAMLVAFAMSWVPATFGTVLLVRTGDLTPAAIGWMISAALLTLTGRDARVRR